MRIAKRSRLIAVQLVCGAGALVTACSDNEPGTPTPTNQTTASASSGATAPSATLPHSGAPKVASPIADTSAWERDPCSVITESQFSGAGLGIRRFEPGTESGAGPYCDWALEGGGSFRVLFPTESGAEGLSRLYENKEKGLITAFAELAPIDGYPAVRANEKDESSEGICGVAVGVRDEFAYLVTTTLDPDSPAGKDPCATAQKIATLAVQTMKGAS